ncbi:MAG: hypothetical protein LBK26_01090 [Rickettsiales bacterium]|jgi:hypothetical protein|nr:hypothetical protein [Rickettsiales bacterium]
MNNDIKQQVAVLRNIRNALDNSVSKEDLKNIYDALNRAYSGFLDGLSSLKKSILLSDKDSFKNQNIRMLKNQIAKMEYRLLHGGVKG